MVRCISLSNLPLAWTVGTVIGTFTSVDYVDMHHNGVRQQEAEKRATECFAVPEHLSCLSSEACKECADAAQVKMMTGL